jgi:hypothetical protein
MPSAPIVISSPLEMGCQIFQPVSHAESGFETLRENAEIVELPST